MLSASHYSSRASASSKLTVLKNLLLFSLKHPYSKHHQPASKVSQGFTLIEILITIMIVAIMAAISIPSFLSWYNNKKIEDATTRIEGALKIVQSSAVKHNISCTITIEAQKISATPSRCLSTGVRLFEGTNANIATEGTGGANITFSSKGTATIVADTSVIVIYDRDAPGSRKMKCIVVSNGIGMMRTGNYQGGGPPADNATVAAVESQCVTPL
jgi:prepilin-type N-terminal cleavage/methylation domain-containing protein